MSNKVPIEYRQYRQYRYLMDSNGIYIACTRWHLNKGMIESESAKVASSKLMDTWDRRIVKKFKRARICSYPVPSDDT